eukprot:TRINITY_DN171_c0_g2_i1.p2 TRINITY_DN171_c0_g2~~TRINITY_DN171_c0_g2_i1.p2  ORF type:complete len:865 (-),score=192.26 TRINITY_DN171_c0_g2_i1:2540-5134(-)
MMALEARSRTNSSLNDGEHGTYGSWTDVKFDDSRAAQMALQRLAVLKDIPATLMCGEVRLAVARHVLLGQCADRGTLVLTNYRLVFRPAEYSARIPRDIEMGIFAVGDVEINRRENSVTDPSFLVTYHGKDARQLTFTFQCAAPTPFLKMFSALRYPSAGLDNVFAFSYRPALHASLQNGWNIYDPQSEFDRLGFTVSNGWRICDANKGFDVAPSYPQLFPVPLNISDATVRQSAAFRAKHRLPVVAWRHVGTGAVIMRAAQPMPGVMSARSRDDEALVGAVRATANAPMLRILDCRPKSSAWGNVAFKGGGYEDTSSYQGTTIEFLGIGNIHEMRDSLQKLSKLWRSADTKRDCWLSELEATHWFNHISLLLSSATTAVRYIRQGDSIFVHCSDGWDRTTQVVSLAMLMLDPFYRTVKGFEVLIEKEWNHMGHPFRVRTGVLTSTTDQEYSPIFYQFLDCVHQLLRQLPTAFEFNEDFLLAIVAELHACRFGTFLCSTEKERITLQVRERTVSLWTYLNQIDAFTETGMLRDDTPRRPPSSHRASPVRLDPSPPGSLSSSPMRGGEMMVVHGHDENVTQIFSVMEHAPLPPSQIHQQQQQQQQALPSPPQLPSPARLSTDAGDVLSDPLSAAVPVANPTGRASVSPDLPMTAEELGVARSAAVDIAGARPMSVSSDRSLTPVAGSLEHYYHHTPQQQQPHQQRHTPLNSTGSLGGASADTIAYGYLSKLPAVPHLFTNPLYLPGGEGEHLVGIDCSVQKLVLWLPRLQSRDAQTQAFVESLQIKDQVIDSQRQTQQHLNDENERLKREVQALRNRVPAEVVSCPVLDQDEDCLAGFDMPSLIENYFERESAAAAAAAALSLSK